jgi:oligopeptide/dipeptide ABC transporter ATP-binding protein
MSGGRKKSGPQEDIPNAIDRPHDCHFHPRCPMVLPVCREQEPLLRQLSPTKSVACHLHDPDIQSSAATA